ncbi:MAG: transposase, partial [Clostridium sp.]|nr:transposase [Clostridium sp.]
MSKLVIPNGYVLKAFLIRLEPNNKQETMLYKTTCTSKTKKTLSGGEIRKELTQLKKTDEYKWVSEFSNNVTKQAIKDCDTAFSNFFKGKADFPKFKSKKKNKWSFFCDGNKTKYLGSHIQIEKIG